MVERTAHLNISAASPFRFDCHRFDCHRSDNLTPDKQSFKEHSSVRKMALEDWWTTNREGTSCELGEIFERGSVTCVEEACLRRSGGI